MIIFIILGVLIVGLFSFLAAAKSRKKTAGVINNKDAIETPIKAKALLTEREKICFARLIQVPNCYVFPQVCLGAILQTDGWKTCNRFNRKIADYVVTDLNFNILAVIELDDKTHDNKLDADKERDAMLHKAGYKTLRYRDIPSTKQLIKDIF